MGEIDKEKKNTDNPKVRIDTIKKDKRGFKVINQYPKNNPKSSKEIEQRLFEIFRKYEQGR